MVAAAGIKGYYRYTDIFFKWSEKDVGNIIGPDNAAMLRGHLAHDALCAPDHPFHVDGDEGVRLYNGTLQNGETRHLFSSCQIEFLCHYLYVSGLVNQRIPLPRSDYLLVEEDLKLVSPVTFPNGGALRKARTTLEKLNKGLKGADSTLEGRRRIFEKTRELWGLKKGVWCAFDLEAWELDHEVVTELGYSLIRWDENGQELDEKGHYTVNQHVHYRNGKYVPEHRNHYGFGQTTGISKTQITTTMNELLERLRSYGPCFLVFHNIGADIKFLRSINVNLEDITAALPDAKVSTGLFAIDTQDMFAALEGSNDVRSLERVSRHLHVAGDPPFHNAGNDAHYTLLSLKAMASGAHVDTARQQRWPTTHATANLPPLEGDDDYSDGEDFYAGV